MSLRLTPLCRITVVLGLLTLAAMSFATTGEAATTPWGELGHFGSGPGELSSPQPAFGVNPEDGSAWAVDISGEAFRIQKFEGGKVVASRTFGNNEGAEPEAEVEVEGVAFDPSKKRAYVLVTEERQTQPRQRRAGRLRTVGVLDVHHAAAKLNLRPAPPAVYLSRARAKQLKGSPVGHTQFAPDDKEKTSPAPSLLSPSGIAVNPTNHEIIVTGLGRQGRKRITDGVVDIGSGQNRSRLGRRIRIL